MLGCGSSGVRSAGRDWFLRRVYRDDSPKEAIPENCSPELPLLWFSGFTRLMCMPLSDISLLNRSCCSRYCETLFWLLKLQLSFDWLPLKFKRPIYYYSVDFSLPQTSLCPLFQAALLGMVRVRLTWDALARLDQWVSSEGVRRKVTELLWNWICES